MAPHHRIQFVERVKIAGEVLPSTRRRIGVLSVGVGSIGKVMDRLIALLDNLQTCGAGDCQAHAMWITWVHGVDVYRCDEHRSAVCGDDEWTELAHADALRDLLALSSGNPLPPAAAPCARPCDPDATTKPGHRDVCTSCAAAYTAPEGSR